MQLSIGRKIKELRKKRGLTQSELAKLVGCAQNTVAEWESERERQPRGKHLQDLAKALGVSLNYLITSKKTGERLIPCRGEIRNNNFILQNEVLYNIAIPNYEHGKNLFAVKVLDNSLSPLGEEEDYCIFEERIPEDNDIILLKDKNYSIKAWRQNETIGVVSSIALDNQPSIFIDINKTKTNPIYKKQKNGKKVSMLGVLVAVKKTLKVITTYPKIKYLFS